MVGGTIRADDAARRHYLLHCDSPSSDSDTGLQLTLGAAKGILQMNLGLRLRSRQLHAMPTGRRRAPCCRLLGAVGLRV